MPKVTENPRKKSQPIGKAYNSRLHETCDIIAKTNTEFLILRRRRSKTRQIWVSRQDWFQV